MAQTPNQIRAQRALKSQRLCSARIVGMKIRATTQPPQAVVGHMPFPDHRTCAEWEDRNGHIAEREMTTAERKQDAREGSARLKAAIMAAAA